MYQFDASLNEICEMEICVENTEIISEILSRELKSEEILSNRPGSSSPLIRLELSNQPNLGR